MGSIYLKAVFFLLVYRVQAAESHDELQGDERLVRLLPESPVSEHPFHHPDDVSLGEAIGDLRQATYVQGIRNDSSMELNDLLPQNCCFGDGGKDRENREGRINPALCTKLQCLGGLRSLWV